MLNARYNVHRIVSMSICMVLSAWGNSPEQILQAERIAAADEDQERCELALASTKGASIGPLPVQLRPRWVVRPRDSLGNIGGVDWDPEQALLFLLDTDLGSVFVVDTSGRTQRKIGRLGSGPGEFDFGPLAGSIKNRIALAPYGLLVADVRGLHLFDRSGKYERTLHRFTNQMMGTFDIHLASSSLGILVSESGKGQLGSRDRDTRTSLWVRTVSPLQESSSWRPITHLRNDWIRLTDIGRFPSQRPYLRSHKRTWDVNGDLLAAVSFQRYGVCFESTSAGLVSSFALDLRPRVVDKEEQERELYRNYTDPDDPLPFLGITARQQFKGKWPTHVPLYVDIVLGPDSVAWALRYDADSTVIDFYHPRKGYLGSQSASYRRLPALLRDRLAFFSVPDDVGIQRIIAVGTQSLSLAPTKESK